jgi:hypothetical protein
MELTAYAQDDAFRNACYEFGLSKMFGENNIQEKQIHAFMADNLQLIQNQADVTYPKNPLWYILSFILVLHLSFLKPVGDMGNFIWQKIRKPSQI